ncbi:MAG TPA: hypothetical protein PLS21_04075 [Synergistales bacterium]|nr:hypothetical protein [Synergistales bacterium]
MTGHSGTGREHPGKDRGVGEGEGVTPETGRPLEDPREGLSGGP